MKRIKLIHIDGKLPNLALMKISAWYKQFGYEVNFSYKVDRDMFEPEYESVFASSIFKFSKKKPKIS